MSVVVDPNGFTLSSQTEYLHNKSGNVYRVLYTQALLEKTLEPHVVYTDRHGGHIWLRPVSEFCDGRFTKLVDRRPCGCTYDEVCICDDPDFD